MEHYEEKYWAKRAGDYNKTEWVKNGEFINSYLSMLPDQKFETILEVGIGTGAVAEKMVEKYKVRYDKIRHNQLIFQE